MENVVRIGVFIISIILSCSVCIFLLSDSNELRIGENCIIEYRQNEVVSQLEEFGGEYYYNNVSSPTDSGSLKAQGKIPTITDENSEGSIPVNCEGTRAGIAPTIINPTFGDYDSNGDIVYPGGSSPTYPYISTPVDPLRSVPLPSAANPVLTKDDVTDYEHVLFVADPFLFPFNDIVWYMFFEVRLSDDHGYDPVSIISYAESYDKGTSWNYMGKVLGDAGGKYSYPHVFKWNSNYYMVPLDGYSNDVTLYKADNFPTVWTAVNRLKTVNGVHDQMIFQWEGCGTKLIPT